MGILDRISDLGDRVQVKQITDELVAIRKALEIGVDSFRQAYGLPVVFSAPEPIVEGPKQPQGAPGTLINGDYLLVWMIEELAHEYRVPLEADTDLEALALQRGWLSPDGKLLVVPKAAVGMEVDGKWLDQQNR